MDEKKRKFQLYLQNFNQKTKLKEKLKINSKL